MIDLLVTAGVGVLSGVVGAGLVVWGIRRGWFERVGEPVVDLSVVAPASVTEREVLEAVEAVLQRPLRPMVNDLTTVVVPLPNEDVKGRLIGREGRNIRTFEELTGVDLIIDETPEAVTLSSLDPYRRTVAFLTLSNLILDGRIHPGRIEEIFRGAEAGLPGYLGDEARRALGELGVELGDDEVAAFGGLLLKQADGVNLFDRTLEVCGLAGGLADELGVSTMEARRAGVMWGIGKSLGGDERRVEDVLVELAVRLSAERSGGTHAGLGRLVERMAAVEAFLNSQAGVERAVAVKAGKEVRVIVATSLSDSAMEKLGVELERKVRSAGDLGGPVKLSLVRRAGSSAKIS